MASNLRRNERRLTTPFDVHATLRHVLHLGGDAPSSPQWNTQRGVSLLNEVLPTRTCDSAFILPHWCTCQVHKKIDTGLLQVREASEYLVRQVNNWTLEKFKEQCQSLRLTSILDARVGETNDEVLRFLKDVNDVLDHHVLYGERVDAPTDYLLTVSVAPSGAVLEGTVRHQKNRTLPYSMLGDVSRLNVYGNQSACITNARLRKFCYCKNQ